MLGQGIHDAFEVKKNPDPPPPPQNTKEGGALTLSLLQEKGQDWGWVGGDVKPCGM